MGISLGNEMSAIKQKSKGQRKSGIHIFTLPAVFSEQALCCSLTRTEPEKRELYNWIKLLLLGFTLRCVFP